MAPSNNVQLAKLGRRSQAARDRALHVIAAMRRDSNLSLSRAAKLEGVKPETVKKYFRLALRESYGSYQATKRDRYAAIVQVPGADGNPIPLKTRSSRDRQAASQYLRDLGRYLRGDRHALVRWRGQKIAGVELVTDPRTLARIEPALSGFSLYREFNGGER